MCLGIVAQVQGRVNGKKKIDKKQGKPFKPPCICGDKTNHS